MTTTPPRTASSTPEAADRILQAAKALFAEKGFEGVSIRDIAGRARVSKANVFHHYGSKAGLYDAVLREASLTFDELLQVLRTPGEPLRERVHRFVAGDLQAMLDDPATVQLFQRQLLSSAGNAQRTKAEGTIKHCLCTMADILDADLPGDTRARSGVVPMILALALLSSASTFFQLRTVMDDLSTDYPGCTPEAFSRALTELLRPVLDHPES